MGFNDDPPHNQAVVVTERLDLTPKQLYFVYLFVTGTIVVKALFSMMARHTLGKVDNRQWYFKVKNGVCKHTWFSKQMGTAVCKASSLVCRSLFGKHLYSIVCSARDRLKEWHGDKSRTWYRTTQNWISFLTVGPILIYCGPHPLLTLLWCEI